MFDFCARKRHFAPAERKEGRENNARKRVKEGGERGVVGKVLFDYHGNFMSLPAGELVIAGESKDKKDGKEGKKGSGVEGEGKYAMER